VLRHPIEKTARPSDREINTTLKLFYERERQKPFYRETPGRLRHPARRVKKPLAVEATQAAAVAKARKLDPEAVVHVERVRNVEGGGRDKWRRI
jgi:hypothetical protein